MLVRREGIRGFLRSITPQKHQEYVFDLSSRIQYKMGRWLIGQFTLIVIIFALDYLVLYSLGVPYALILALLGGLLEIIPYIGPTLALLPATLVALTVSPFTALLVVIFYVLIQPKENYVLTPMIMKRAVGLDPVVIILSLLIGGILAGFLGVLIAVPFATAVSVFMRDLLDEKKKDEKLEVKKAQI
jgi:predicted PurR-regulated permease PerM